MILNLENKIESISKEPSDINEHIYNMVEYAKQCNHITEMGVRSIISTWAWLHGLEDNSKGIKSIFNKLFKPTKKLVSYDLQHPDKWGASIQDVYDTAEYYKINFQFYEKNVLDVEIDKTDLLFLDTWHSYKQLKAELGLHSEKAKKYIIFHDTTSYADKDEHLYEEWGEEWKAEGIGIWKAIEEFLNSSKNWQLHKRYTHNNGLTVIKRIR
jgi:CDP-glycerol glycerophosphotransferase (TagB/SpsB family)